MALELRGISYFADQVPEHAVQRDLEVIKHDLNCDAVLIKGNDAERQLTAARQALQLGLDVWIEAQQENQRPREALTHLARAAAGAQELHAAHPGRVTLVVGCELSLLTRGIVPGPSTFIRLPLILRAQRVLRRRITRRLKTRLAEATAVARTEFDGPITYAAALWEHVDWSDFDLVAVNLYRIGPDKDAYAARVRSLVHAAQGKPVVITEFGCGAYRGAELAGPGSFQIVNWFRERPRVKPGHIRDESVQAGYLLESLDVFTETGVHGCFVFTFVMPSFPHDPDPQFDLDMAGFGVVKVPAGDPTAAEPKAAFHALALRYRRRDKVDDVGRT